MLTAMVNDWGLEVDCKCRQYDDLSSCCIKETPSTWYIFWPTAASGPFMYSNEVDVSIQ